MWARYLEMLIGSWLIASPWIFSHTHVAWFERNDIACGAAVIAMAILSFFRPTRMAHFVTGAIAFWLGASAYFLFDRPGPPAAQNEITAALLLLMLFLIPNEATQPPEPWRGGALR